MYKTDHSIQWDFEQEGMLDIREILYQEALAKINELEYELKMAKWDFKIEKSWRDFYEEGYDRLWKRLIEL